MKSGKLNVFLLFLGLSFMFLLLTKLNKDYTKTISFAVHPVNARADYVILKDSVRTLDITLRTYGFKLMRYYLSNPDITIDLKTADVEGHRYIWTKAKGISYINSQFDDKIRIIAINPDTLTFNFDVNAIKKVPVQLRSNIAFVPGYDVLDAFEIKPDSIKIIGPKVMIDTIQQVNTVPLVLKSVSENIDAELQIVLPDSSNNVTYSHKKVAVSGKVERFTEGEVEVPVDLVHVPEDIQVIYFPKTVTVKYYTSLSHYKTINKSDFIVECDYKDLDSTATFMEPKLVKYPSNIKNVKLVQKQIDFIISR